jgi:Tfp pilus assembly protein PilX
MNLISDLSIKRQNGAVLIVALLFLVAISLLTLASMRASNIGLRMAHNEESSVVANQGAQALADFVVSRSETTPVTGTAGFTICTTHEPNCDRNDLPVNNAALAGGVAARQVSVRVQRMAPAFRPPPRTVGASLDKFTSASFRVSATYDRTTDLLGQQQIVEGVMILVPTL